MPVSRHKRKTRQAQKSNALARKAWAKIPKEVRLVCLTNTPTDSKNQTLATFYEGVFRNDLIYVDALHKESGEVHQFLGGIVPGGGVHLLARIVGHEDVAEYVGPDTKGGWVNNDGTPYLCESAGTGSESASTGTTTESPAGSSTSDSGPSASASSDNPPSSPSP